MLSIIMLLWRLKRNLLNYDMMKVFKCFFAISVSLFAFAACNEPDPVYDPEPEVLPVIEIVSPAEGSVIDLSTTETIDFEWVDVEGVNAYKIYMWIDGRENKKVELQALRNPYKADVTLIDEKIGVLGVDYEQSQEVVWTVKDWDGTEAEYETRKLTIKRLPEPSKIPYEERIAESLTVPVAIVIEDPVYNGRIEEYRGMKLTEIPHKAWGRKWADPKKQMLEFERDMEASSHGVVQYEVVDVIEADRFFSYYRNDLNPDTKEYLTVDTLVNYIFRENPVDTDGVKWIDKMAYYDYVGMMQHYGFDKMVDAGTLKEVWVYTHPASGMNESRLIGEGAFWCNSTGIDTPEATNKELCCVMFCNYERTTDLAMHSYAHRVESIMSQVYENKGGHEGWNYHKKLYKEELTNWERFSAHELEWKKYEPGYAHIGICHYPCNATGDYNYDNARSVMSYADTWFDYPDIKEDETVARKIDRTEWADQGGFQWGYMKWYFEHIPHFKGLNEDDMHLNNWWHYIVDYNAALVQERRLRQEL